MTKEEFDALSNTEKSKISGLRHLSEEEVGERARKSEVVVSHLFRKFFGDILANENIVIGHLKTDEEKESTLKEPLNNLFQEAISIGATYEDILALERAIDGLLNYFKRINNSYYIEIQKFMYATLGENYIDAAPIKDIIITAKTFKDVKDGQVSNG